MSAIATTAEDTTTITRSELKHAINALNIDTKVDDADWRIADRIIGYVKENREPEYEPGDVYVSALNIKYYRREQREDGLVWLDIQNGEELRDGVPARPLRKLVREGSQAAKLSHVDVCDTLALGLKHHEWADQLADRVCKLLAVQEQS